MEVSFRLCDDLEWEPVYWFTMPDTDEKVKQKFPNTIRHNYNDSIRGKTTPELKERFKGIALDEKILSDFYLEEYDIMNMIDRNDMSRTFSYLERVDYYHELLSYWLDVFDQLKPDIVFMEALPHEPNDLIIWSIAQRKGIQVISFCGSLFSNRIFPIESYKEIAPTVKSRYDALLSNWKGEEVTLADELEERIRKIRGDYSKNLRFDVAEGVAIFKDTYKKSISRKINEQLFRAIKLFNVAKFGKRMRYILSLDKPSEQSYQKQPGVSYKNSAITNREFNKLVNLGAKLKKELHDYHEKVSTQNPDLTVPFIYCPLHYQPEATTSPMGGYFVNQKLMVKLLASSVPAGWKIYVKDHIGQFIPNIWGETARTKAYYDELLSIPNVEILPLKYDSYTLIDHCKAVATVTGTVSFEGPVRGKAALCFGYNLIFNPCDGIFYTPTSEKIKEVLNKVEAGYKPDLNKIRLYLKALYESTYPGGIGSYFNTTFLGVTREQNIESHYQATIDFLQFINKKKQTTNV
jgi:hypothetical protein